MSPSVSDTLRAFDDRPPKGDEAPWFREFKKRRQEGVTSTADLKRRAVENHEFAAPGEDQLPYEGEGSRGSKSRRRRKFALMSVNEVAPVLDQMSGRQVMGRFERRYIPRRREIRGWAEKLSTWDRAVVDACHADQEESAAFRNGPGIAGVAWLRVTVDYLEDPEGKIVIEEIPLWRMLWGAKEARKKNLIDRDWSIEGDWYTVPKFKAMWPTKAKAVRDAVGKSPPWSPDTSVQAEGSATPWDGLQGSSWQATDQYQFFDPKEKQVWVERYEWREPQIRFWVMVPAEGGTYEETEAAIAEGTLDPGSAWSVQEMSPEDFRAANRAEEVPANRYVRKERMVYLYAYVAGDTIIEKGEIPTGRWTYEALTGKAFIKPDRVIWRSVVDLMRTPQIWYNIFLTMLVKYMQVNPKGVLFVERGMFRNRNEGLRQFSSTGGLVEFERGKLSGATNPPYQFHTGGPSPMGGLVERMMQFSQELLPRSAGFNQAAMGQLGSDLRRISGTVVQHVQDAMVAAHADLYDSHALARQRVGLILLATLSKVLGVEHMERVVGDDAFLEEITDPTTGYPLSDPTILQQLIEAGQIDPAEIVQGDPGEPFMRRVEPPEGLLDDAVWSVSVEETKPAPDRARFFWESLTESGGIQALTTPDSTGVQPFTAEEIVELVPDIPEDMRKRRLNQIKMERSAMMRQQMAAQPEGEPPPEEVAA